MAGSWHLCHLCCDQVASVVPVQCHSPRSQLYILHSHNLTLSWHGTGGTQYPGHNSLLSCDTVQYNWNGPLSPVTHNPNCPNIIVRDYNIIQSWVCTIHFSAWASDMTWRYNEMNGLITRILETQHTISARMFDTLIIWHWHYHEARLLLLWIASDKLYTFNISIVLFLSFILFWRKTLYKAKKCKFMKKMYKVQN